MNITQPAKESRIYRGDCRDILPTLCPSDLLLSDPPYNIGFKYRNYRDAMSDSDYIDMLRKLRSSAKCVAIIQYPEETMRYVAPALGAPDKVICWAYNSNIRRRWRMVSVYGKMPDFKRIRQPYKNQKDKRIAARIAAGHSGSEIYDWWADIQLVKNVSREKTAHPCPIPEALVDRIIALLTNPGDTVIDPFAGGGTVPCVAHRMGRVGLGIELDNDYAKLAEERLESAKYLPTPPIPGAAKEGAK